MMNVNILATFSASAAYISAPTICKSLSTITLATVGVPAFVAEEMDEYEVHRIRYGNSYGD